MPLHFFFVSRIILHNNSTCCLKVDGVRSLLQIGFILLEFDIFLVKHALIPTTFLINEWFLSLFVDGKLHIALILYWFVELILKLYEIIRATFVLTKVLEKHLFAVWKVVREIMMALLRHIRLDPWPQKWKSFILLRFF